MGSAIEPDTDKDEDIISERCFRAVLCQISDTFKSVTASPSSQLDDAYEDASDTDLPGSPAQSFHSMPRFEKQDPSATSAQMLNVCRNKSMTTETRQRHQIDAKKS